MFFSILFLFFTLISTTNILSMCSYNLFRFYYHLPWKECFECVLKSLQIHSIFINIFFFLECLTFHVFVFTMSITQLVVFLHLTMYDTQIFFGWTKFQQNGRKKLTPWPLLKLLWFFWKKTPQPRSQGFELGSVDLYGLFSFKSQNNSKIKK
jgi:hypothetical protein